MTHSTQQIFLWNDEKKTLRVAEASLEALKAPFVRFENQDYYKTFITPQFYFYPLTEEAFHHFLFMMWRSNIFHQNASDNESADLYDRAYHFDESDVKVGSEKQNLDQLLYSVRHEVTLQEDHVGYFNKDPRQFYHQHLFKKIRELPEKPKTIMEVGFGAGENLLALKREFPEIDIIGCDFSQQAVNRLNYFSKKFSLPMDLFIQDYTRPFPEERKGIDLIFSMGAFVGKSAENLERGLANIFTVSRKTVFIYDIFIELMKNSKRAWAALMYAQKRNGLIGGFQSIVSRRVQAQYCIRESCRLKYGANPVSEMGFVWLDRLENPQEAIQDNIAPEYFE